MRDEMTATLNIYRWPSQAFWRYFELQALKEIEYDRPILEIGCGDGQFASLLFAEIDEGIDVNPRAVEKCQRFADRVYRRLQCLDARQLQFSGHGYGTIYANCVMEHIPEIQAVLAGCYRGLRRGGKLVMTVPLAQMNDHLLFRWRWYAKIRQRQLVHVNLFTAEQWKELLLNSGFSLIEFRPYLSAEACKFWDAIDSPGCIGFGRYRVASIIGGMFGLVPAILKDWTLSGLSGWLTRKTQTIQNREPACAAIVMAQKAGGKKLQ